MSTGGGNGVYPAILYENGFGGQSAVSQDRVNLTLAAVLGPYQSLLRIGNDGRDLTTPTMPHALHADGYATQAAVWELAASNFQTYGSVPDVSILAHAARELRNEVSDYEHITDNQIDSVLRNCHQLHANSLDHGYVRSVLSETMETYLVHVPKAHIWGSYQPGTEPPRSADERAERIRLDLQGCLARRDEPEGPLTDAQLDALLGDHEELVSGVLVAQQLAVIGGPQKSLKTQIGLDMALSLATGTDWLGHPDWACGQPRRVAF